jgi:hypothetical protein
VLRFLALTTQNTYKHSARRRGRNKDLVPGNSPPCHAGCCRHHGKTSSLVLCVRACILTAMLARGPRTHTCVHTRVCQVEIRYLKSGQEPASVSVKRGSSEVSMTLFFVCVCNFTIPSAAAPFTHISRCGQAGSMCSDADFMCAHTQYAVLGDGARKRRSEAADGENDEGVPECPHRCSRGVSSHDIHVRLCVCITF